MTDSRSSRSERAALESAEAFLATVEWNDHTSETDAANLREQIRAALDAPVSERGTSYDAATAWLIERSDGSRELVFSPLTDDVPMDEGDEARPLYERNSTDA